MHINDIYLVICISDVFGNTCNITQIGINIGIQNCINYNCHFFQHLLLLLLSEFLCIQISQVLRYSIIYDLKNKTVLLN